MRFFMIVSALAVLLSAGAAMRAHATLTHTVSVDPIPVCPGMNCQ